jgi:uroporphyrinogen decarboxylase
VPPAETLGEATHFRTMLHPLETVTDIHQLESLPWPEWVPPGSVDRMRADAAAQHERGHVVAASCECTLFEHAWYLRGMDNLFMDLVEDNGIAPWLLDHFTERSIAVCRAYVEAGADVIGLGDDVGTQRGMMMSLADWRTHLRPRLKRVIDAIRDAQTDRPVAIRYHSDGDIRAILDDLVQIGVDILNPVQPECMPVDDVVSQHRDRLGFWGIMGTQTTMPFGSPQDVRGVVDDCVRRAAEGAAIVLAPTHVLEPDVPDENTIALATADRRIGLVAAEQ